MTDSEIIDLMYEHATAFSNCVQFSEQGVLDFARAVRDFVPPVRRQWHRVAGTLHDHRLYRQQYEERRRLFACE